MTIRPRAIPIARHAYTTIVRLVALGALLAVPYVTNAQPMPVTRIDSVFATYDSRSTPGCAVAVLRGDSVAFRKTYGMAHIGFGVPMTTATTMWIPYSEARTFVALGVATLVRDGRLTLDDPVRRHIPELPAYASAVTVRHLLHHTSGLADYGVLEPAFDLTDRLTDADVFRMLGRWGKLVFEPGRGSTYSNTDYALLRLLVERVSGRSLHDHLHTVLLDRLDMRATRIGAEQGSMPGAHALFHEPIATGWRSVLRYRISPVGGISVSTNLDDMVKWARAVRDSSSGIASLLASLEGGAPEPARATGFAYGVYAGTQRGLSLIEHRGIGEYRYLTRVPAADLSVVTLCNAYLGMWTFGPAVAGLVIGRADTLPPPASLGRAAAGMLPTVPVPTSVLGRYVGEYVTLGGGETGVRMTLTDSVLAYNIPGGRAYPMRPIGGGRFEVVLAGIGILHFTMTDSESTPGGVRVTAREVGASAPLPDTLRRKLVVPTSTTSPAALRSYVGAYAGEAIDATMYVTVDGDRLLVSTKGLAPTELRPGATADTFQFTDYDLRFARDAAGRVTHLVLDASRVKGMRFTRRPVPRTRGEWAGNGAPTAAGRTRAQTATRRRHACVQRRRRRQRREQEISPSVCNTGARAEVSRSTRHGSRVSNHKHTRGIRGIGARSGVSRLLHAKPNVCNGLGGFPNGLDCKCKCRRSAIS